MENNELINFKNSLERLNEYEKVLEHISEKTLALFGEYEANTERSLNFFNAGYWIQEIGFPIHLRLREKAPFSYLESEEDFEKEICNKLNTIDDAFRSIEKLGLKFDYGVSGENNIRIYLDQKRDFFDEYSKKRQGEIFDEMNSLSREAFEIKNVALKEINLTNKLKSVQLRNEGNSMDNGSSEFKRLESKLKNYSVPSEKDSKEFLTPSDMQQKPIYETKETENPDNLKCEKPKCKCNLSKEEIIDLEMKLHGGSMSASSYKALLWSLEDEEEY